MARTKYSYKYNGHIVRNSNRLYKHGLVNHNDAVIACSGTEKGALKEKISWQNHISRELAYYEKKNEVNYIDDAKHDLENIAKWHVVELEVIEN